MSNPGQQVSMTIPDRETAKKVQGAMLDAGIQASAHPLDDGTVVVCVSAAHKDALQSAVAANIAELPLTAEAVDAYLENDGMICPFCRMDARQPNKDTMSDTTVFTKPQLHKDGRVTVEAECNECKRQWTEVYALEDCKPAGFKLESEPVDTPAEACAV